MCLAIPSRIVEKNDLVATVDVCGARREVNLMLLPEEAEVGDYVLVHAGFAMQKVDMDVARDSLALLGGLVEAERSRDQSEAAVGEAAEMLEKGTLRWENPPGKKG
jgi:hydrogenase expression/formation protein HypC